MDGLRPILMVSIFTEEYQNNDNKINMVIKRFILIVILAFYLSMAYLLSNFQGQLYQVIIPTLQLCGMVRIII